MRKGYLPASLASTYIRMHVLWQIVDASFADSAINKLQPGISAGLTFSRAAVQQMELFRKHHEIGLQLIYYCCLGLYLIENDD